MYKRILVPLDGSSMAEFVLEHVRPFAQAFNTEIILLEVLVEPNEAFATHDSPLAPSPFVRRQKADANAYLKTLGAKLEGEGMRVSYLVREGGVPETILDVADFMEVDAIAMSTHGHSLTRLFLLGSVTYQVVRRSPLPVLVVHPDSIRPPRERTESQGG